MSNELIQAKTFQECVSDTVSEESRSAPDKPHDQIVAIAHNICRKKFGMSKALLVYFIEKSQFIADASRIRLGELIRSDMSKDDFIELGLLFKSEGLSAKEVAKHLPYKSTWVKQNIHPLLNTVAEKHLATNALHKWVGTTSILQTKAPVTKCSFQKAPVPALQKVKLGKFYLQDLKKESREFTSWGSVEVVDSQGDKIPMEDLKQKMPIVMRRGGVIMYGHSNRHVGRLTKYNFQNKDVDGEAVPGILLDGQIFNDYKIDDMAWEAIQLAKANDLPVMSLGATPLGHPTRECDGDICWNLFDDNQYYEWTVTEIQQGSIGANPEAKVEKLALAKSDSNGLVNLMLATCPSVSAGNYTPEELIQSIERDLSMDKKDCNCQKAETLKQGEPSTADDARVGGRGRRKPPEPRKTPKKRPLPTGDTHKQEDEDVSEEPEHPPVEKPGDAAVVQALNQLNERMMAIEQKVGMNDAEQPPMQETPGDEKALTLSKEQFEVLAKERGFIPMPTVEPLAKEETLEETIEKVLTKKGFQSQGSTPAPQIQELQKITTGDKTGTPPTDGPSPEDFIDAMKKGKLDNLRRRYNQ